jgi:hypothetical protein
MCRVQAAHDVSEDLTGAKEVEPSNRRTVEAVPALASIITLVTRGGRRADGRSNRRAIRRRGVRETCADGAV